MGHNIVHYISWSKEMVEKRAIWFFENVFVLSDDVIIETRVYYIYLMQLQL